MDGYIGSCLNHSIKTVSEMLVVYWQKYEYFSQEQTEKPFILTEVTTPSLKEMDWVRISAVFD